MVATTALGGIAYLITTLIVVPLVIYGMEGAEQAPGVDDAAVAAADGRVVSFLASAIQPFSPMAAVVVAAVLTPLIAVVTRGRYYLRRHRPHRHPRPPATCTR
ncbi:hypothetical protein [Saccharopolyspora pogona]|uniref:hypothetical protein n=1 Tax=Saccharopolyspora pogona TaxID=333966 RepID=UPI001CC23075|nr:hypothetical protein [Saccharopolyspora pogona]